MSEQPKKKVLIIDDDPDDLFLIKKALEERDFECLTVLSPVAGLELAVTWQPDIIVLDLMLPMMSGYGFLRELKKSPKIADIPVVVLTSLCDDEIASVSVDIGASAFISKDSMNDRLVSTIDECAA